LAVDLGAKSRDEAIRFERAHAPPGRRRRQADAHGQLSVGQPRITLQFGQDGNVVAIESERRRRTWHHRGGSAAVDDWRFRPLLLLEHHPFFLAR
jgi:hypothetical protein